MFQIHKLERFYPDNGEVTITYKKSYDKRDGCNGEIYDEIFSSNDPVEDLGPYEEFDDDMEDYDPELFCPDITMELGDTPIIIHNDELSNDGSTCNELTSLPNPEDKTIDGRLDLSPKEIELRNLTYGTDNPVRYAKIHCTTCNDHLGSALSDTDNIRVHPLLKVLICKECDDFYTSGDFEKDQDGSETYCRWCGQGGLVICCSNCEFVFCTKCIRNNLGKKVLADIRDNDEWTCFKCDPSQLSDLRVLCAEFMDYVRRETARGTASDNSTTDYSRCCSTANAHASEPKKPKRKYSDDDLDYDPDADRSSRRSSSSSIKSITSICNEVSSSIARKPLAMVSKPTKYDTQGCQNSNATRPKATFAVHPKPVVQMIDLSTTTPERRVDSSQIRTLPNFGTNFGCPSKFSTVNGDLHQRKKMCYETAVRTATRINSDLSCGLIKLRENKAVARSLEDLVVVHNKLQEVLNTSIDSLIHLRKTIAVADMNNFHKRPVQQQLAPKQFLVSHDRVSNILKVGNVFPSTVQNVIGRDCRANGVAGSSFQNRTVAPFFIFTPDTAINL